MKNIILTTVIAAAAMFAAAPTADAQRHHRHHHAPHYGHPQHDRYIFISGYQRCGTPIYSERYVRHFDRRSRPVYGYRVVHHRPQFVRPTPRGYYVAPPPRRSGGYISIRF